VTDSSSDDEVDDEPPTKTRRAGPKGRSAGTKGSAKLNSAAVAYQQRERSMHSHEQPHAEAEVHVKETYTQSRQVERLYMLACTDCGHRWTCKLQPPRHPAPTQCRTCEQHTLSVTSDASPIPPRNAALSTAFDEAAAAWGAKMKKTFGTVTNSRIPTEPHQRVHENMPQGNSHHKRCGAIDWHTGPTLDQCSGGDHLEGTSPDDGMNGSPQRISSADSIETLEEPSCSTSGETTKA